MSDFCIFFEVLHNWRLLRSVKTFWVITVIITVSVLNLSPLAKRLDFISIFHWFLILKTSILNTITGWYSFTFWLSRVKYWIGSLISPVFTLQHWFAIMESWVRTTNCRINFQFFYISIRLVWRYGSLGNPISAFLTHHNTDLCPCLYISAQIFKLRRIPTER